MGDTVWIVFGTVVIAFWAGSRWRHNTRTWADHREAHGKANDLRVLRWVAFRAMAVAIIALAIWVVGVARTLPLKPHQPVPATANHTTPPPQRHKAE
jgi:hypothetical protein